MAFDPIDWIAVADELAAGRGEARLRAAIGRYYYGVFLKSRLSLTHDGKIDPAGRASDHSLVMRELKKHRSRAGMALENLARLRERADYEASFSIEQDDVARARAHAMEVQRMCQGDWERLPS